MKDAQCHLRLVDAFYPEIPRKQQAHFSDTPLSILPLNSEFVVYNDEFKKTYPSINQAILLLILIIKYCTNQSKIVILQLQHRISSLTTLLHPSLFFYHYFHRWPSDADEKGAIFIHSSIR